MKNCKKPKIQNGEKAITLIALVITIIILLILAAISIATLTGENGVLTKASKSVTDTDIAETKEQIKLELMGNLDEQKTNYTNEDVVIAVKKITNQDVDQGAKTVKSLKGNDVDIEELWVNIQPKCYFRWHDPSGKEHIEELFFQKGDTWSEPTEADSDLQVAIDTMADAWSTSYYLTTGSSGSHNLILREVANHVDNGNVFKVNGDPVDIYEEIIANAIYYFDGM